MVKVAVPNGMLEAACKIALQRGMALHSIQVTDIVEAAIRWLAENPIVPTIKDVTEFASPEMRNLHHLEQWQEAAVRWQRRMFVASEQELQSFDTPFGKVVVDPRVPPGEIRLHSWNGPTLLKNACLCIEGCSVNGECPIHGDKGERR